MSLFTKQNNAWIGVPNVSSKQANTYRGRAIAFKEGNWKPVTFFPISLVLKTVGGPLAFTPKGTYSVPLGGQVEILDAAGNIVRTYPYIDIRLINQTYTFETEPNGKVVFRGRVSLTGAPAGTNFASNAVVSEIEYVNPDTWVGNYPSVCSTILTKVPTSLSAKHTSLRSAFYGCTTFNQDLSSWDTTNVVNTEFLFYGCSAYNQPLNWNTPNLENAIYMFAYCSAFNQPINFNTAKIKSFNSFLINCGNFNQPLSLVATEATSLENMLQDCEKFNSTFEIINGLKITNAFAVFPGCKVFNQPVQLDSNVLLNTSRMFFGCTDFNSSVTLNTSSVRNMSFMFQNTPVFNQDLQSWDVGSVINWADFRTGSGLTTANTPPKFR